MCVATAGLCFLPTVAAQTVADTTPAHEASTGPEVAASQVIPSVAALEAAGAVIGEIRIRNEDIFDLSDPKEDAFLFGLANRLHIKTREGVISRTLLFKSGELFSARRLEESERLLHTTRFLYEASVRPVAYRDGIVDIEVLTRDSWSLDPGLSFSRSGGANSSSFTLREFNLLGTGAAVSLGRSNKVDRSSNEFRINSDRVFGSRVGLSYSLASSSDGRSQSASVVRPFYALDARWTAGASAVDDNRIESIYTAGAIVGQYRHKDDRAEVFGGVSDGLVNGWTKRYVVGITSSRDEYFLEPGLPPPQQLPSDRELIGPYFRFQAIEDDFRTLTNRNQIGRAESFALGFTSTIQVGRSIRLLGSSANPWLFSASASKGFAPRPHHDLITTAALSGEYDKGRVQRWALNVAGQYYMPLNKRVLLYASASADALKNPEPSALLTLGGDNGLRGYPLRYQSGERRAVLTLEARAYSDFYLFRLFRFGGAVYYDLGRAWGGSYRNTVNPGWMNSVGAGLRIFSTRAAFGNVVHVDIAAPLNGEPGVKSLQYLVTTRNSF